jgi:hypothetical protein
MNWALLILYKKIFLGRKKAAVGFLTFFRGLYENLVLDMTIDLSYATSVPCFIKYVLIILFTLCCLLRSHLQIGKNI